MKKSIFIIVLLIVITFSIKLKTNASENKLYLNEENFPDLIFREYISDLFDLDKDGLLTETEINTITTIEISNKNISSLKGIEHFDELTNLNCSSNQITTLDTSYNLKLNNLSCYNNKIEKLDVSNNLELTVLSCSNNKLTNIDVSKNLKLEVLMCSQNKINTLDVTKNQNLYTLHCDYCNLSELNLNQNSKLTTLGCSFNHLTSLDFVNTSIINTTYYNNYYYITLDSNRSFDLNNMPKTFDITKASNWKGGTINDNILTFNQDIYTVTYSYQCGKGKVATFFLHIHGDNPEYVSPTLPNCMFEVDGEKEYYLCSCGERFSDSLCTKIITNHDELLIPWSHKGGNATCSAKATCTICKKQYGELNPTKHNFANELTKSKDTHYYQCIDCETKKDEAPHEYDHNCDPTCNVCDYKRTTEHVFESYQYNDDEHWQDCKICGIKSNTTIHSQDNCICGYQYQSPEMKVTLIIIGLAIILGTSSFLIYKFVLKKK